MPRDPSNLQIDLAVRVRVLPLGPRRLANIARMVWRGESSHPAQISIALVGDRRMQQLTERYTGRRYNTDVLAFELSDRSEKPFVGQVVINGALARRRGDRTGTNPSAELALYLVHGLLHLLGYEDHTDRQAQQMHRRALAYLRRAKFRITPSLRDLTAVE